MLGLGHTETPAPSDFVSRLLTINADVPRPTQMQDLSTTFSKFPDILPL